MELESLSRDGSLYQDLTEYKKRDLYPLHMPGHKRRLSTVPGQAVAYDFTEVEGTDDLHAPTGILRDAMDRAADMAGADRTWFLVNGSTCGNLAGIFAMVPYDGELIVARNCHRSVFHALELKNVTAHWLFPRYDREFGIAADIDPQDVEQMLEKYPKSSGVMITSPTYEGVVSDIAEIARICHAHGVPLMVDEAHGAHFGLVPDAHFPDSSIHLGADLSVQSAHKTLTGLTQTAFLHLKGTRIDPKEIEDQLDIFETSSPSYPLMLSLDGAVQFVKHEGQTRFLNWKAILDEFDDRIRELRHFRVLCHGQDKLGKHEFFGFDQSKIPISTRHAHVSGARLAEILRKRFHLETEMQSGSLVLAMTGPGDEREGVMALADALLTLDREEETLADARVTSDVSQQQVQRAAQSACDADPSDSSQGLEKRAGQLDGDGQESEIRFEDLLLRKDRQQIYSLRDAARRMPREEVPIDQLAGRICAQYVYCYPPGIPFLLPGQLFDREDVEMLGRLAPVIKVTKVRCVKGDCQSVQ